MSVSFHATTAAGRTPANGNTARREATRRRLLDAGTALFAELGLHGVTSAGIAQQAGVATGTFYLHFSDKHALFAEIVSLALEELASRQEHAVRTRATAGSELRVRLEELVRFTEEKCDLIRVVFARGAESGPLAQQIHDRVAADLETRLAHRVASEGLPIHPGVAAQARAATLTRVIAWWAEDPSRASREDLIETLLLLEPGRQAASSDPQRQA